MGKNEETTTLKRSWFQELKGEFHKIVWPDKKTVSKQTVAVLVIAVILGCLIAGIDWVLQIGLKFVTG